MIFSWNFSGDDMESTKKKKIACKSCLSWKFVDTQYRNDFGKECKLMEIEILNSCVSNRANILAHNWTNIIKNIFPKFPSGVLKIYNQIS